MDLHAWPGQPQHARITYMRGSSVDPSVLSVLQQERSNAEHVMVVLDSDHSESHVSGELAAYSQFVSPGCYLIVEDTNVDGHPVAYRHGPGPMEAVRKFLANTTEFHSDLRREKFHLTFNPKGYLQRVKDDRPKGLA